MVRSTAAGAAVGVGGAVGEALGGAGRRRSSSATAIRTPMTSRSLTRRFTPGNGSGVDVCSPPCDIAPDAPDPSRPGPPSYVGRAPPYRCSLTLLYPQGTGGFFVFR